MQFRQVIFQNILEQLIEHESAFFTPKLSSPKICRRSLFDIYYSLFLLTSLFIWQRHWWKNVSTWKYWSFYVFTIFLDFIGEHFLWKNYGFWHSVDFSDHETASLCKESVKKKIIISAFLQLLELSCKSWFIKVTSKFQKTYCFSQNAKKNP